MTLTSAGSSGYSLTGHTVYEGIAHGFGLYAIGRGLFGIRSSRLQSDVEAALRRLEYFAGVRHARDMAEEEKRRVSEP